MATATKNPYSTTTDNNFNSNTKYNMANTELSQELHIKMSKKIAQLTKVIYALNTKNDEHELLLEQMKTHYEERILQLMAETKERLTTYQSQLSSDITKKKQISQLEESLREHERVRAVALKEFSAFKSEVSKREQDLINKHTNQVTSMTKQLMELKTALEESGERYSKLREEFERRKQAAIDVIRANYEKEIENHVKSQRDLESNLSGTAEQLHKKYQLEVADLRKRLQDLDNEKRKSQEEAEDRLKKLQAFHEREMEAVKNSHLKDANELEVALQNQIDAMKKEYFNTQAAQQKRIEDLLTKLGESENQVAELTSQINRTSQSDDQKTSKIIALEKQIQTLQEKLAVVNKEISEKKDALVKVEEINKTQAKDIQKKANVINELQTTIVELQNQLSDSQQITRNLKSQLKNVQDEKHSLETVTYSRSSELEGQLRLLQDHVNSLQDEKKRLRDAMELKFEQEKADASNREKDMKKKHDAELEKFRVKSDKDFMELKKRKETEVAQLKEEYDAKLEAEMTKRRKAVDDLNKEMEKLKKDSHKTVEKLKEETETLRKNLKEQSSGLGDAASQLESYRNKNDKLRKDLENVEKKLKITLEDLEKQQAEMDNLRLTNESLQKDTKVNWNNKLAELSTELDRKWAETLRRECGRLRSQLQEQAQIDKQAALDHLTKIKDREMEMIKSKQGMRITELEINEKEINAKMDQLESALKIEKDRFQRFHQEEGGRLHEQLRSLEDEQARMLREQQLRHDEELDNLRGKFADEMNRLKAENQSRLNAEQQVQESRYQAILQKEIGLIEKKHLLDLEELQARLDEEKNQLRFQLQQKFSMQLENQNSEQRKSADQLSIDLENIKKTLKQKELEFSMKEEQLSAELRQRDRLLVELRENIKSKENQLNAVSDDLSKRSLDVSAVKEDIVTKAKRREQELINQYTKELNSVIEKNDKEKEELVRTSQEAQQILKDKILDLHQRYQNMEAQFNTRPSREEDIDLIDSLKGQLKSIEKENQRLMEEKRYYQMELVNRETNFNKVFNSTPQVGTINPLLSNTVTSTGSASTYKKRKSSMDRNGSVQKLAPLPNSPLHDDSLNPSKPLPPPHSKR